MHPPIISVQRDNDIPPPCPLFLNSVVEGAYAALSGYAPLAQFFFPAAGLDLPPALRRFVPSFRGSHIACWDATSYIQLFALDPPRCLGRFPHLLRVLTPMPAGFLGVRSECIVRHTQLTRSIDFFPHPVAPACACAGRHVARRLKTTRGGLIVGCSAGTGGGLRRGSTLAWVGAWAWALIAQLHPAARMDAGGREEVGEGTLRVPSPSSAIHRIIAVVPPVVVVLPLSFRAPFLSRISVLLTNAIVPTLNLGSLSCRQPKSKTTFSPTRWGIATLLRETLLT
ncbi:hypothetical protein B0H11DRAFT_1904133 [Mycena galericulata]|nr:hypothetical protein B0H11DRAFT_1904133 [Mycena galericulata]